MSTAPRDYRAQAALTETDLDTLFEAHTEAFDCLVFKAIVGSEETVTSDVEDVAGSLESVSRGLSYADPIQARAIIIPDDNLRLQATMDGEDADYYGIEAQQPIALILSEVDVPQQSIIRWREYADEAATEPRVLTFYVLRSEAVGRSPAVSHMKHYCIPFTASGELEG